jgi:hypothetical protein
MSQDDRPTPAQPPAAQPPGEDIYSRKLILAILSTLQHKGLLSSTEVDHIILAARRSAEAAQLAQARQEVRSSFSQAPRSPEQGGGKRPVPVFDIEIVEK